MTSNNPIAVVTKRIIDLSYLIVLGVLVFGVMTIFVQSLNSDEFHKLISKNPNMFIDYIKLYAGAKIVAAGQGHMVYAPEVQSQFMNQIAAPSQYPMVKFIQYPPYDFAMAIPLTVLPLIDSFAVWTVATMLIGCGGVYYLRRVNGQSMSIIEGFTLVCLYAGSLFSFNSIILGQTAWLMLGIVSLFFAALLQKKEWLCGLAIAVSTIKPQLLLLLAPPIVLRRMWKAIVLAAVAELLFLGLAFNTVGWDNIVHYPSILAHAESGMYGRDNERMVSIRGLASALFGGSAGFGLSVASLAIALGLFFWFWWKADDRHSQIRAISLSVLVFLIFSPHSFLYDCLILSLPTVLLMRETTLSGAIFQPHLSQRLWGIILLLMPVVCWAPYLRSEVWCLAIPVGCQCCITRYLVKTGQEQ